jgi:hypothetical protein
MNTLYGLVLLIGFVGLVGWIVVTAVASSVDGWGAFDPETRFGTTGRSIVAGSIGFGMAGISMLYTTLPSWLSLVAALIGAAALIVIADRVLPPRSE